MRSRRFMAPTLRPRDLTEPSRFPLRIACDSRYLSARDASMDGSIAFTGSSGPCSCRDRWRAELQGVSLAVCRAQSGGGNLYWSLGRWLPDRMSETDTQPGSLRFLQPRLQSDRESLLAPQGYTPKSKEAHRERAVLYLFKPNECANYSALADMTHNGWKPL